MIYDIGKTIKPETDIGNVFFPAKVTKWEGNVKASKQIQLSKMEDLQLIINRLIRQGIMMGFVSLCELT